MTQKFADTSVTLRSVVAIRACILVIMSYSNHLLLSTISNNLFPSYFELYILDKVEETLQPALEWFSSGRRGSSRMEPMKLSAMLSWLFLQFSLIEGTGSSVVEHWFGIRRMASPAASASSTPMSAAQRRLSFVLLNLAPKLVAFLNVYTRRRHAGGETAELPPPPSASILTRASYWASRAIHRSLPYLESSYGIAATAQSLRYLFGLTAHYTPAMAALGIQYEKQSTGRKARSSPPPSPSPLASSARKGDIWSRIELKDVLIATLLALKAADYLTRSTREEGSRSWRGGEDAGYVPPPPLPPATAMIPLPTGAKSCPLCGKVPSGPCAAPSGYIFCFTCLSTELERNGGVCPVTGQSCSISNVIQIFSDTQAPA